MRIGQVQTIITVDRVIPPTKVANIALIKDIRNLTAPARGIEIIDVVGGDPSNDILASDVGASLSSAPTSAHNRLLVPDNYTPILTSRLKKIMRSLMSILKRLRLG